MLLISHAFLNLPTDIVVFICRLGPRITRYVRRWKAEAKDTCKDGLWWARLPTEDSGYGWSFVCLLVGSMWRNCVCRFFHLQCGHFTSPEMCILQLLLLTVKLYRSSEIKLTTSFIINRWSNSNLRHGAYCRQWKDIWWCKGRKQQRAVTHWRVSTLRVQQMH
jgi:hypothetical protein